MEFCMLREPLLKDIVVPAIKQGKSGGFSQCTRLQPSAAGRGEKKKEKRASGCIRKTEDANAQRYAILLVQNYPAYGIKRKV